MIGLSCLSWAILGAVANSRADAYDPAQYITIAFHLAAGFLFLNRRPAVRTGGLVEAALCAPSVAVVGMAFTVAPPTHAWTLGPAILLFLGAVLAIGSLFTLGGNFAIFPAFRTLVNRGPYRFVRHPAYLGELALLTALTWSASSPHALLLLILGVIFVRMRITTEEKFLLRDAAYARYATDVKWRLVPGLW